MNNNFINNNKNFENISNLVRNSKPKELLNALNNLDTESINLLSSLDSDLEKKKLLYNEVNYYRFSLKYSHYALFLGSIFGFLIASKYSKSILEYGSHYFGESLFMGLGGCFLGGYLVNIYSSASFFFKPNKENLKLFENEVIEQNQRSYTAFTSKLKRLLISTNTNTTNND